MRNSDCNNKYYYVHIFHIQIIFCTIMKRLKQIVSITTTTTCNLQNIRMPLYHNH